MILNLLYPPACLHCKEEMEEKGHFCTTCLNEFALLRGEGRCLKCFSEIEMLRGTCKPCRLISHPFRRFGACFDGHSPARSLLYGNFATLLASYVVVQLDALGFPEFDLITTIPGYFKDPSKEIAKELAKMLHIAYKPLLNRALNPVPTFSLKKKCNIINQNVLLLENLTHSREVFYAAAKEVQKGWCESLYGMTVCVF